MSYERIYAEILDNSFKFITQFGIKPNKLLLSKEFYDVINPKQKFRVKFNDMEVVLVVNEINYIKVCLTV